MVTRSARGHHIFEPAQLLSNWDEQRPSNKGDVDASVTMRLGESITRQPNLIFISVRDCCTVAF
jgi:hypothetical protein